MCPTAAVSVVPERERPELDAVLASFRMRRRPIPGSRRRAIFPFYCCWQSGSWRPGAAGKKASHVEDRFPGASHPAHPPPYLVTCTTFGTSSRVALEISRWQYSNIHAIQLFSEMAASPGTELVSPASPPTTTSQTSHLKAYPYLFVRETDQVEDWIDSKKLIYNPLPSTDGLLLHGLRGVSEGGGTPIPPL